MKKLLLFLPFCFTLLNVQAQELSIADDKLDKFVLAVNLSGAEMLTREMQQALGLNMEQCAKVASLNAARYKHIEEAETLHASDPTSYQKVLRNIHIESDKALQEVLTEPQLQAFFALKAGQHVLLISENDSE